jgi:DNA/RNA endonuclease G (NUC1)
MRSRIVGGALTALSLIVLACSENAITGPDKSIATPVDTAPRFAVSPPTVSSVRISELHYDNGGTDAGEAFEISGPAGASVNGWKVFLYNGSNGAPYDSIAFTGTIPATCTTRGVISTNRSGIQNGDPDGIALVDASRNVIEFLSYEGVITGFGGPANGIVSRDIGVREAGTEATSLSLHVNSAGTWFPDSPATFGACNDNTTPTVDSTVASVKILPASATLVAGATLQLADTARNSTATLLPGALIGWNTSNAAVATVDVNGLVKAVAAGSAEIIAVSTNSKADTTIVTVNAAPPPSGLSDVRFTEIHYDNDGTDINEAIEIEGPAGGNLSGWQVVLYNQTGGAVYNTRVLDITIPDMCNGRGVVVVTYPSNGIQNGDADGFALVNSGGQVVEFLSYEGTLTASNGPASGLLSTDIGVDESSSSSPTRSLQRTAAGEWYGPFPNTMGACNPPDLPPPTIFFSGRLPSDVSLPVGFQDQLFATLEDARGVQIPTTFTWTSETPSVATIDTAGVFTGLTAGSATFRATAATGATGTWTLPVAVATQSLTANYANNTEFGVPADADASDDFIITHPEYTSSFSATRGTPNWVSYDLDASHFGAQDRCDCFTFDPAAAGIMTPYTTNAYTGSAAINGFGIDRGHLARSFDRTAGSLDNAFTFYFSNIVPQASDLNQGPWADMENDLGDSARFGNREVYIIAGVAGNRGTLKNQGLIVIPEYTWKVAVIMPRDQGLASVDSRDDIRVIAAVMPNTAGVRNVDWHTYITTVDSVEALSGYDVLSLLPDPIEIAVESNTVPPVAAVDGPYNGITNETIEMSAAGSTDADAGQALTYAWDFGDGATGSGLNVTHSFATAGTFTVRLIVTDPLTLADTITTTATIITPAAAIGEARDIISDLQTAGKLGKGNAKSLNSKLDAIAASLARGNSNTAANQLKAMRNEINSLVADGVLAASDAAALLDVVNSLIDAVS